MVPSIGGGNVLNNLLSMNGPVSNMKERMFSLVNTMSLDASTEHFGRQAKF